MKKAFLLKICGLKYSENITAIAALEPDYMGFIFYEKSARFCNDPLPEIPKTIKKTGVFVDADLRTILETIERYELQAIQLHGSETPEICAAIRSKSGVEIIKTFSIDTTFDFRKLQAYETVCDYYLFDTKGKLPGGNGFPFDWTVLKNYPSAKPYFLSGGITIDHLNTIQAAGLTPYAIDINSKFETAPGLKDITLCKQAVASLKTRTMKTTYRANEQGYYGEFGGAFIPEMLYPNVEELRQRYLAILEEPAFQSEFLELLTDYVGRPTPLYYAERLSKKYNTRIYLKREDLCHTGAHKINNTIGQVLLAKRLGKKRIIAETGAGQHGVATATVCALMGLECIVYMGEIDIERQAPNVARMKMLGAEVRPATSGSKTLKDATNEAIRDWINNPVDTYYIIGSVVGPHPYPDMVARFQSVISAEIQTQLFEKEGRKNPDYVIACVGGGSNAAGAFYHFLDDPNVQLIAVEAAGKGIDSGESAATSVLGKTGVIHGSKTLLMQSEDGQITEPYSISAGLDYPGVGPLHAHLFTCGRAEFAAATDDEAMQAGLELCKTEGIIPAIESAHALAVLKQRTFEPDDIVVINLSGRGDKDLSTYTSYFGF